MMNYNGDVELFQIDQFDIDAINEFKNKINNNQYTYCILEYPVLYILANDNKVYVGETTDIVTRLKNHKNDEEKEEMKTVYIFSAEYFNQSLVENLEAVIIDIFSKKGMAINKTKPCVAQFHNYFNKTTLLEITFKKIHSLLQEKFPKIDFKKSFDNAIQHSKQDKDNTFDSVKIIDFDFNEKDIKKNIQGSENYPCVYLLRNDKKIYIGETANILNRLLEHKNDKSKNIFTKVSLITFHKFNNSATYDLETSLLNYFLADEQYTIVNKTQKDKKIVYSYFDQLYYHNKVFNSIWKILLDIKIAKNEISHLKTKDLFKISPFISLTPSQNKLKDEIFTSIKKDDKKRELFIIKGEAGSGKSVLISSLYNEILDFYETDKKYYKNNYLLVNHEEMLKTYQLMAKYLPLLVKKNIMKPTSFINSEATKENPGYVTIIDEGHTLLSSSDPYNSFSFNNHLEEIIKRSTKVVLVFDQRQFLKLKSYWEDKKLDQLLIEVKKEFPEFQCKEYVLETQLRMECSQEIVNWIDAIVQDKRIEALPPIDNNFELEIFDDCSQMFEKIKEKNNLHELSRMVSTFDYVHKKDGAEYYIEEGNLKLPWNVIEKEAWAQRDQTINEIGSIYTIQGFDLNYAGVILGPSLSYDSTNKKLKIDTTKYKDTEAFRIPPTMKNIDDEEKIKLKEKIILNSLNVLMKRPIKGLYIYASNKELREKMYNLQN